ncbi:zinc finger protein 184-like [Wyeomyia smithii]|uniref:zinc finger protein 184-like n=1 Tax=Wyeomyia smithii TaxID=174621 RepID=UPI002467E26F|nr:zinc finger protein 184-like [Wyeomyia smithii]
MQYVFNALEVKENSFNSVYEQPDSINKIMTICALCSKNEISLAFIDKSIQSLGVTFENMIGIFKFKKLCQLPKDCCLQCFKDLHAAYIFYCQIEKAVENIALPLVIPDTIDKLDYDCKTCNYTYQTDDALLLHNKLVHSNEPFRNFKCNFCNNYFKTRRGRQQHLVYCNNLDSNKYYHCNLCRLDFHTKANFLNHMKHHQDFVCRYCNRGWFTEAHLLEHVESAHADRLFQCGMCTKTDKKRKTLNRHQRLAHGTVLKEIYCGYCSSGLLFNNATELNKHINLEHKCLEQPSAICNELLNVPLFAKELEGSLVELDNERDKPKQGENQEIFLRNFNLLRTTPEDNKQEFRFSGLNHNKMILEEFLDEAFENDQIWTKYIEGGEEYLIDNYDFYLEGATAKVTKKYKCPMCHDDFDKQYNLTTHLAETHDVACLICNDCGANFNKISEYNRHRQDHLKENARFRENIIPEAEEALSLVRQVERTYDILETSNSYSFRCKFCDRRFIKKSNLEKHHCSFYMNKIPSQDRNVQSKPNANIPESLFCTLCDKKFKSISGLKYHLKRHTAIKAFPCFYCSKEFTASSNLNAHIRNVHNDQKSYLCIECEMRFASKDHLTKHIRFTHRLERTFLCPECPKRYFQKSHLNDHVTAAHTGYKAFSCEACSTFYSCRGSLRRHITRTHKVL